MFQRKYFFDSVRGSLFAGNLTQKQVDGMNLLLDRAEQEGTDDRHLAYILATSFHETAQTMQPIAEYGKGSGKSYGKPAGPYNQIYYGRGFVQLTWEQNYKTMQDVLGSRWGGRDIYKNADRAMDPDIATDVIFYGMMKGSFTGVGMPKYITTADPTCDTTDFYNCRKVVNGLDQASTIQGYAQKFANALAHAESEPVTTEV
jgi:putative chitinase